LTVGKTHSQRQTNRKADIVVEEVTRDSRVFFTPCKHFKVISK